MNVPQHDFPNSGPNDAGRHYARLRHVLGLVEQIAGEKSALADAPADESTRISIAYQRAPQIARRRFDTLVAEASAWTSSGIDALAAVSDPAHQPRSAAGRLAEEIDQALGEMTRVLRL